MGDKNTGDICGREEKTRNAPKSNTKNVNRHLDGVCLSGGRMKQRWRNASLLEITRRRPCSTPRRTTEVAADTTAASWQIARSSGQTSVTAVKNAPWMGPKTGRRTNVRKGKREKL